MTPDEIAKRPTPLTKAQEFNENGSTYVRAEVAECLAQDRAALMEALELCVVAAHRDIVEDFSEVSNAADSAAQTLAAVREREEKRGR